MSSIEQMYTNWSWHFQELTTLYELTRKPAACGQLYLKRNVLYFKTRLTRSREMYRTASANDPNNRSYYCGSRATYMAASNDSLAAKRTSQCWTRLTGFWNGHYLVPTALCRLRRHHIEVSSTRSFDNVYRHAVCMSDSARNRLCFTIISKIFVWLLVTVLGGHGASRNRSQRGTLAPL